ncbi:MAG: hypothetical protein CMJ78_06030 [Planctomycetaceae bacterium]|nr:hypothetical protein [Planctomycetaceae bacterium]
MLPEVPFHWEFSSTIEAITDEALVAIALVKRFVDNSKCWRQVVTIRKGCEQGQICCALLIIALYVRSTGANEPPLATAKSPEQ